MKKMTKVQGIYDLIETDAEAEVTGVWVKDILKGFHVLVGRVGNSAYKEEFRERSAAYQLQLESGTIDDDILYEITTECMASTVFLDFDGPAAVDREGKPLEHTRSVRLTLLEDLPDLRARLWALGRTGETFRKKALEMQKGNSQESSEASSPGQDSTKSSKDSTEQG